MAVNVFGNFTDEAERRMFMEAQHKTIVEQSKKITQLEEEVQHLKKLLASTTPLIAGKPETAPALHVNDEESIARIELKKLRDNSLARELTMEEARKVEIYAKLLHQLKDKPKEIVIDTKKMPKDQLLTALDAVENE